MFNSILDFSSLRCGVAFFSFLFTAVIQITYA